MFPLRLLPKMKHRFGYVTREIRLSVKRIRGEEAAKWERWDRVQALVSFFVDIKPRNRRDRFESRDLFRAR
jgi:hypothetical protein